MKHLNLTAWGLEEFQKPELKQINGGGLVEEVVKEIVGKFTIVGIFLLLWDWYNSHQDAILDGLLEGVEEGFEQYYKP